MSKLVTMTETGILDVLPSVIMAGFTWVDGSVVMLDCWTLLDYFEPFGKDTVQYVVEPDETGRKCFEDEEARLQQSN